MAINKTRTQRRKQCFSPTAASRSPAPAAPSRGGESAEPVWRGSEARLPLCVPQIDFVEKKKLAKQWRPTFVGPAERRAASRSTFTAKIIRDGARNSGGS